MKKFLPLFLLPFLFSAQNPAFKKLMDAADTKYAVKSYKDAYKEYDEALKLISADLEKMVSTKEQATKDKADWLKCLSRHARCAYYTANVAQAVTDAEKLLAIDSVNADAHAIKGYSKYKSGDKMNGCREIRKQQAKGSDLGGRMYDDCFCWSEGVNQFREANSAFSLSKNNDALAFINNAIDILPDSLGYQIKKGEIVMKMENYPQAITMFTNVINKDRTHFKAWYLRGLTNLKMGKADSAFKDLSECIKLNAYSYDAYYKRAEICEELKEYQSAIYDYKQCLRLKPDNAELHYKIAVIKKDDIQDELGGCEEFIKAAAMGYEEAVPYAEECKNPKKKKK